MNGNDSSGILDFDSSDTDDNIKNKISLGDEDPPVPWTELPWIAVEKIYLHLSRGEQFHMSMVCRNWNKEYSSPSLWRKVKFFIPEHELDLEFYPEVYFARKYGGMFHHAEIVCRWIRPRLLEIIRRQLKLFLEALTFHSQLESFTFHHIERYFRYIDNAVFGEIYQTILDFFSSQHKLKDVEFRNALFKTPEAAEILKVIFLQNSNLQNVCLDAFLEESDDDKTIVNVLNESVAFESLLNLKRLQLDYSQIFENIVISFYEYAQNSDPRKTRGNLELITISCDGIQRNSYRGIPPECWKILTKKCPSLRINLNFQNNSQVETGIQFFIVRNMPLKKFDFKWFRCQPGFETEIGVLFRHLHSCRTNEYLEDLSIVWLGNMNNLATDLINFLQICKKLRVLQLYIEHPTQSLDMVFISWVENRPLSLENVCITVGKVRSPEEAAIYSSMAEDYCPLLQIHGLTLFIIVDYDIGPRRI